VAIKLQQKGLLTLEKDKKDARATRLKMTEESHDFWKRTDPKGEIFRDKMFKEIDSKDIVRTRNLLEKILSNLAEIEKSVIDDDENS
jgi:DNA-binding MarR family transcriptional regulator